MESKEKLQMLKFNLEETLKIIEEANYKGYELVKGETPEERMKNI